MTISEAKKALDNSYSRLQHVHIAATVDNMKILMAVLQDLQNVYQLLDQMEVKQDETNPEGQDNI